jgi:hypothetical protein
MVFPETRSALTIVYFVLSAVVLAISRRDALEAFRWMRPARLDEARETQDAA